MTGLVGWWPLHRTEGDAVDLSGEGNGGTVTGATRGVAGRGGLQAFSFDGVDDNVDTGNAHPDGHSTVSFWMNPAASQSTSDQRAFSNLSSGAALECGLIDSASNWGFVVRNDGGTFYSAVETKSNLSDGNWYHMVGVLDGSSITYYRDAGVVDSTPVSGSFSYDDGSFIGSQEGNVTNYQGVMFDVRVYDRALSASEVQTLYDWGGGDYAQPPSDLLDADAVSYWPLDEDPASTSTATDQWGTNDGTITGASQADPAIRGTGLSFDGTDDYVDVTGIPSFTATTVAFWCKTADATGARPITFDNNSPYISIRTNDGGTAGKIEVDLGGGGPDMSYTAPTLQQWQHIAVTGSDGGEDRLFLNGRIVDTASTSSWAAANGVNDYIGQDRNGGSNYAGDIDDVRVYSRALSPAEIHEVYQYGTFGRDLRKETVNAR